MLKRYTARVMSSGDHVINKLQGLRSVIAVYSSHPTSLLSLLNRSTSFEAAHLSAMEQRWEALEEAIKRLNGARREYQ